MYINKLMENQDEYSIDEGYVHDVCDNTIGTPLMKNAGGSPGVSFIIDPRMIPTTPQQPSKRPQSLHSSATKDSLNNSSVSNYNTSRDQADIGTLPPPMSVNTECDDATHNTSFGDTNINSLLDGVNDEINKLFDGPQTTEKVISSNDPFFVPVEATNRSLNDNYIISACDTYTNSTRSFLHGYTSPHDTMCPGDLSDAMDVNALVNTNRNSECNRHSCIVTVIEGGRRRLVNGCTSMPIPKQSISVSDSTKATRPSDGEIEPSRRRIPNNGIVKQSIKSGSCDRAAQSNVSVIPVESNSVSTAVHYQLPRSTPVGNKFTYSESSPATRRRIVKVSNVVPTIVESYQNTVQHIPNLLDSQQFRAVQCDMEAEQIKAASTRETHAPKGFVTTIQSVGVPVSNSRTVSVKHSTGSHPSNVPCHQVPSSLVYCVSGRAAMSFTTNNVNNTPGAPFTATRSLIMSPRTVHQSPPGTIVSQEERHNHICPGVTSEEGHTNTVLLFNNSSGSRSLIASPSSYRQSPFSTTRTSNGLYCQRRHLSSSPPSHMPNVLSEDVGFGSSLTYADSQKDEYNYSDTHSPPCYRGYSLSNSNRIDSSYHPSSEELSNESPLKRSSSQDTNIVSSLSILQQSKVNVSSGIKKEDTSDSPNYLYYSILLEFKNKRMVRCRAEVDLINKIVAAVNMNEEGNDTHSINTTGVVLPGIVGSYFVFRPDDSVVDDHEDVGLCVNVFSANERHQIPRVLGITDTGTVVRMADAEDCRTIDEELPMLEEKAMESCHNMIHFLHLPLICVDAEYTFDKKVVVIYYILAPYESMTTVGDGRLSRLRRELSHTLRTKVMLMQRRDLDTELNVDLQSVSLRS